MLVAKQQTTQPGYEITWRTLHESPPSRSAFGASNRPTGDAPPRLKTSRRRLSLLARVSAFAVCVVGLMLGYLAQQAVRTELVYERQSLEVRAERLEAEAARLALESDRLASYERVARVATAELGMHEPEMVAHIPLDTLDSEAGRTIRTAMGVESFPPGGVTGADEGEPGGGGRLGGATRVAWVRVSHWFSDWVGLSTAEARSADAAD